MQVLTTEELEKLKSIIAEDNKIKAQIGALELQKQSLFAAAVELNKTYAEHEKELVEKYGQNLNINIETGEITPKEEEAPQEQE
jgi:hypothetical protein